MGEISSFDAIQAMCHATHLQAHLGYHNWICTQISFFFLFGLHNRLLSPENDILWWEMPSLKMQMWPASHTFVMEYTDSCDKLLGTMPNMVNSNGPQRIEMKSEDRFDLNELVRLNVGGTLFITSRTSLERIPGTRLSNLSEDDRNYNPATHEWFFDRNPMFFNNILDYFRSDDLHFPHNYCGPSIKKELVYWKIQEGEISPCCWNKFREYEEEQKIYNKLDQAFESKTLNEYSAAFSNSGGNSPSHWQIWRRRICIFLEEPMSSKAAKVSFHIFFILFQIC